MWRKWQKVHSHRRTSRGAVREDISEEFRQWLLDIKGYRTEAGLRELVVTDMILDLTLRTKSGMANYVPDFGGFV